MWSGPGIRARGDIESRRELRARSGAPAQPFMEPEFTLAVGRVRPRARVAVIGEESGATAGFLPFGRGPLGHGRAIDLGVSDVQGAVLRPGLEPDAKELLRACGLSAWEFDNLEEGQGLFAPDAARADASYVIDVGDGYAAYEKTLRAQAPKFLRTTLAKERKLGRDAGEVRFVLDERDPEVLGTLMGVEVRPVPQDRPPRPLREGVDPQPDGVPLPHRGARLDSGAWTGRRPAARTTKRMTSSLTGDIRVLPPGAHQ